MDDPYLVLGVARDCDAETLKITYRRLVRDNHPDVTANKAAATLRMAQINAAWALVGDPQKRAAFDLRRNFDERQKHERAAHHAARSGHSAPHTSQSPSAPRRTTTSRSESGGRGGNSRPPSEGKSSSKPSGGASPNASSRHARLAEASRLLFKQNKPGEALEICRAILKTDFRNIPARELMGEAYLRLGQIERALAVWEQALILSPNNAPLRRRWTQLKSPDARSQPMPAPRPANPALGRQNAARAYKDNPTLLSRLIGRFKKR